LTRVGLGEGRGEGAAEGSGEGSVLDGSDVGKLLRSESVGV